MRITVITVTACSLEIVNNICLQCVQQTFYFRYKVKQNESVEQNCSKICAALKETELLIHKFISEFN